MNRRHRLWSLLFVILITGLSCGSGQPPSRLSGKAASLLEAYVELFRLREQMPETHPAFHDSSAAILNRQGFTRETFEAGLAWLNEKPERWQVFYDKALKRLDGVPESGKAVSPPGSADSR